MDAGRTVVILIDGDAEVEVGRLGAVAPDLALVDALARLQLLALRQGCSIELRDVTDDLAALLELVGLTDLLMGPRGSCPSRLQAVREPEGLEQLGIEEVVEPDHPTL
jgi:hypothetical protein